MKDRLLDWPTTVMGVATLVFVGVLLIKHPDLAKHPELLIGIVTGVVGFFLRSKTNNGQ